MGDGKISLMILIFEWLIWAEKNACWKYMIKFKYIIAKAAFVLFVGEWLTHLPLLPHTYASESGRYKFR